MRWWLPLVTLSACSLTPIPDVSSEWPPPCPTAQRRCDVDFTFAANTEQSVEVRGDFADGGWEAGVPMARDGGVWQASVPLPWGETQYKFFVDGTRWVLDPSNPQSVPDGKGNTNSILRDVTCTEWACTPAP